MLKEVKKLQHLNCCKICC